MSGGCGLGLLAAAACGLRVRLVGEVLVKATSPQGGVDFPQQFPTLGFAWVLGMFF
jgi:hypothetical protein